MLFLGALAAPDAFAVFFAVAVGACLCGTFDFPFGLFGLMTAFSGCLAALSFVAPEDEQYTWLYSNDVHNCSILCSVLHSSHDLFPVCKAASTQNIMSAYLFVCVLMNGLTS